MPLTLDLHAVDVNTVEENEIDYVISFYLINHKRHEVETHIPETYEIVRRELTEDGEKSKLFVAKK